MKNSKLIRAVLSALAIGVLAFGAVGCRGGGGGGGGKATPAKQTK